MKHKLISLFCVFALALSLCATPVFAVSDNGEATPDDAMADALAMDITEQNNDVSELDFEAVEAEVQLNSLDNGLLIEDLTPTLDTRSATSGTQKFEGYLTAEGQYQYVLFTMYEGEIVQATLECPQNASLDYDLLLCTVADDGTLKTLSQSALGTYIDTKTNKTADEGIAYIHSQATPQAYAILVISTIGSSAVNPYNLTLSLDAAGAYDNQEPNDNPFTATPVSLSTSLPVSGSVSASLNVVNDQDWYAITVKNDGVFKLSAGNYVAEAYYVTTGNKMVLAPKASGNYILSPGIYYIKVSSDTAIEDFTYGSYTLSIADQSKYSTMSTAFNLGNWDNISTPTPQNIPLGQYTAYYKFNIDSLDKVYAYIFLNDYSGEQLIEALTSDGKTFDLGYTGNADDVNHTATGRTRLVLDVDGTRGSTIYLRVTRADPLNTLSSMTPHISNRLQRGDGTFTFSGTASNSGNSYSSIIYCNLTNNSSIPKSAIVYEMETESRMSQSVGGVTHRLNPDGRGWVDAKSGLSNTGRFEIGLDYNVSARSNWQFMYYQSAFASTKMTNVELALYWYADISENNYELWGVS